MGWDEKLFKYFWDKTKFVGKKSTHQKPFESVSLEELQHRLFLFSTALAGQPLLLRKAESVGGFVGASLFLPTQMEIFTKRDMNVDAYLFRCAYSIKAFTMGLGQSQSLINSPIRPLLDLAIVPSVEQAMIKEYPGLEKTRSKIHASLCEQMSHSPKVQSFESLFEAVRGVYIGAWDWPDLQIAKSLQAWKELFEKAAKGQSLEASKWKQLLEDQEEKLSRNIRIPEVSTFPIWGRIPILSSQHQQTSSFDETKVRSESLPTGEEHEKKPIESAKTIELDEEDPEQMPIYSIIEQVKTAEKYLGGKKILDGSNELKEHLDALQEVDVREVFRSQKSAQSIFRSEMSFGSAEVQVQDEEQTPNDWYYDEWDYKKLRYRPRWCRVIEKALPVVSSETIEQNRVPKTLKRYKRELNHMEGQVKKLLFSKRWVNRQKDGSEFDLDALIDRYSTLKAGSTPPEELYSKQRKSQQDVALMLLLDNSLSTDSWIAGRKVADIQKDSVLLVMEAFKDLQDQMGIMSFHSHTRRHCTVTYGKDFGDKWNKTKQAQFLAVDPCGYTRIGPALRHAKTRLVNHSSKRKAILLITDGKPTDYDAYEGKHGIEDVRKAVSEANQMEILVYSLAIDSRAKSYFPRMFGNRNFNILKKPEDLPEGMIQLILRLIS